MTPIEKAKELVEKFSSKFYGYGISVDEILQEAKQCAIICCDEVIKEIPEYLGDLNPKRYYWQSVKTEIQNL